MGHFGPKMAKMAQNSPFEPPDRLWPETLATLGGISQVLARMGQKYALFDPFGPPATMAKRAPARFRKGAQILGYWHRFWTGPDQAGPVLARMGQK